MRLYYYDREPNFGDALNSWLWAKLLPGCWDPDDGILFSGIGTIINADMPAARKRIVFSSGVGYGAPPEMARGGGWDVIAVRGPLTAAALKLGKEKAVTDGAILLAALADYAPLATAVRNGVVFVPHHSVDDPDWGEICREAGVEYVSPRAESRLVVERIRRARLVLADAMHAAIVADTLRVPWIPLTCSAASNTFKWLDWTESMRLRYEPMAIPSISAARRVHDSMAWLSGESHRFKEQGPDAALRHFRRDSRMRERPWWSTFRRFGKSVRFHSSRAIEGSRIQPALAGHDRRAQERAATALAAAARQTPSLSDPTTFSERLDALLTRLRRVEVAGRARAATA